MSSISVFDGLKEYVENVGGAITEGDLNLLLKYVRIFGEVDYDIDYCVLPPSIEKHKKYKHVFVFQVRAYICEYHLFTLNVCEVYDDVTDTPLKEMSINILKFVDEGVTIHKMLMI